MAKWSFSVHGVTRIITSNIYTRLAACNCISITFWSGDLPSPLMAIFYIFQIAFFFKLIFLVYFRSLYFTSSCDELYIFNLYLATFVLIIP